MSASESSAAVDCCPASRSVSRSLKGGTPTPSRRPSPSSPPRLRLDLDPSVLFFLLSRRVRRVRGVARGASWAFVSVERAPPSPRLLRRLRRRRRPRKRQRPLPRRREQTRLPRRRVFRRVRPLRDGPRVALDKLRRRERSRVPPTRRAPGPAFAVREAESSTPRDFPPRSRRPRRLRRSHRAKSPRHPPRRTPEARATRLFSVPRRATRRILPLRCAPPRVVNRRAPAGVRRALACARFARSNALAAFR